MTQTQIPIPTSTMRTKTSSDKDLSFLLTTSIFTPYPGPPSDSPPADRNAKFTLIIQNLKTQHQLVRQNILATLAAEKKRLIEHARGEIAALEERQGLDGSKEVEAREEKRRRDLQRELDDMVRMMRSEKVNNEGEYEYVIGSLGGSKAGREEGMSISKDGEGDVVMEGVRPDGAETTEERGRNGESKYEICMRLDKDVMALIERGTKELKAYDAHVEKVIREYKHALERGKLRSASMSGPTGILKTSGSGRMSAGQSPMDSAREGESKNVSKSVGFSDDGESGRAGTLQSPVREGYMRGAAAPVGILKNSGSGKVSTVQSPVDGVRDRERQGEIRRLSNGMPVMTENAGKSVRISESIARRESR